MTLRAFSSYGFEVNGKLTLRVAITRVKCFAITGAALDQMARPTLGYERSHPFAKLSGKEK